MRSVKVHWAVGLKQKQWLSEEVFWNIIRIQTNNWTKYALRESTLVGWLQAEGMASRRSFSKQYTYSNIQLIKICTLWKYTEWWASSRSNGLQKKFFKTLYIIKHTIEQNMHSVKVQWVLGFKHKQWLAEEIFWNIIHMQTYNWTKYAFCEKTLSGGPQAEAIGFRDFSKHYTLSNIQLNNACALWKFTECWASSRSNDFQKKFFKTLYIFKHTLKQSMLSVKVTWVVGFKHTQWVSEEYFQSIIHIQTYNWTRYAFCESALSGGPQAEAMSFRKSFLKHNTHSKIQLNNVCALWKFTAWWASSRNNASQKKFFETLYTFKHTIEQCMRSAKV